MSKKRNFKERERGTGRLPRSRFGLVCGTLLTEDGHLATWERGNSITDRETAADQVVAGVFVEANACADINFAIIGDEVDQAGDEQMLWSSRIAGRVERIQVRVQDGRITPHEHMFAQGCD